MLTMLSICSQLFENLKNDKIRYCHWKSNHRLEKALFGKTDLDILVHEDDKNLFFGILKRLEFKQMLPPLEKQYAQIEHYLGIDYPTGKVIHLHVYYRLILGQRFIKNHHLPIETLILDNLVTKNSVDIPCPELELIMLVIRAHMKVDILSVIKHVAKDLVHSAYTPFPVHIEEEMIDLISKIDLIKLDTFIKQTKLPLQEKVIGDFVDRFSKKKLRSWNVIQTWYNVFSNLKDYRRQSGLLYYLLYIKRAILSFSILLRIRPPEKKILTDGGRFFAIVGADGAGKSTLAEDVSEWLSWKLMVMKQYYGISKNNEVNYFLSLIAGIAKVLNFKRIASIINAQLWIRIARDRNRLSNRARDKVRKGCIIIADRYPLKELFNMREPMDGPRLSMKDREKQKFWATKEKNYYEKMTVPDKVFLLKVSLAEARRRKNDISIDAHKIKIAAINSIVENSLITIVDANRSYDELSIDMKRKIWESL